MKRLKFSVPNENANQFEEFLFHWELEPVEVREGDFHTFYTLNDISSEQEQQIEDEINTYN